MFRIFPGAVMVFLILVFPAHTLAQLSVRASYGSLGVSQVILPLGVRTGMFQKNGLTVEPIYIAGRSVSALVSGDVQFGFMGGPPAVLARVGGAEVVMIAGRNVLDQVLVAVPSIKKPADLIGKNLGISRFGTTSDYGARIGLKRLKLQPQKDVTLIQIGDTAARIGGMTSGALAAATLSVGEEEYIRKLGRQRGCGVSRKRHSDDPEISQDKPGGSEKVCPGPRGNHSIYQASTRENKVVTDGDLSPEGRRCHRQKI
ncbi:MAG: ABC transporter substrate-binding protein [Candidatus Binatia bacterium]